MNAWKRALRGGRHEWQLQVLSVFSVGVAFLCLTTALVFVTNVQALRDRWTHTGRASVFLQADASHSEIQAISSALQGTPGVSQVEHITSEIARGQLLRTGDDVLTALPLAAFPASLEVQVHDPEKTGTLKNLAERLQALPKIEAVETYDAWGDRLAALLGSALTAAGVLALVVFVTVVTVVGSTIRLSLQHRRVEVQVLKVVGATDAYVCRPFVLEGAAQGALGALSALGIVVVLYLAVSNRMGGQLGVLLGATPHFLPWYAALGLVGLGTVLGASSAHLSVRRMLST